MVLEDPTSKDSEDRLVFDHQIPLTDHLPTSARQISSPSKTLSRRILEVLRPQILSDTPRKQLRSTAYLDGLRGVAAFIVYIAHSEAWNHDVQLIQYGFGYRGHYAFMTLPFIRVFFTGGHVAVATFFVISGYVLSQRPLSLIHQKSEAVYAALSSAVFRRAIRLYFPFIAVTVSFFTIWHIFGVSLEWPKPQASYFAEIVHWWNEFTVFTYPLKKPTDEWFSYDFPLWTIPIEFQGSILVFISLIAFARITVRARLILVQVMALYSLHCGEWQMTCFLNGMFLAELDLLVLSRNFRMPSNTLTKALTDNKRLFFGTLFVLGMYLASQPAGAKTIELSYETPGWYYLTSLIPPVFANVDYWRFWAAFAAPMIITSITYTPFLRQLLSSRFPQYLGKISFALYLVHIPIAGTIGDKVFRVTGFLRPGTSPSAWDSLVPLPRIGILGLELDFLGPQLIILPITFYVAELATKLFDEPSITLGKTFYESVIEY